MREGPLWLHIRAELLESWDPFDYLWGGFISADFSLAARPFVTVVFLFQNIVTSGV